MKQLAVISHGKSEIDDIKFNVLKDKNYIAIHVNTEKNQPDKFKDNLRIGDIIILYRSNEVYGVGEILANYQSGDVIGLSKDWIIREYKPIHILEKSKALEIRYSDGNYIRSHWSPHANRTFFITNKKDFQIINEEVLSHLNITLEDLGVANLLSKSGGFIDKAGMKNNAPLNQILYGPPGTGKTYKIQNIAKNYVDNEFNEASYLANIVKNLSWLEVIIFSVLDIGKPCKLADILKNRFHRAKLGDRKVDNAAHIDQVLVTRSIRNPTNLDRDETIYPRREPLIFDRNHDNEWFIVEEEKEKIVEEIQEYQSILQLVQNPTLIMNKESQKRYEIVTFHQSFSYEDFVEGIRAFTSDDNQIQYSVVPGVFKEICDLARKTPEKRFAIFIDEINRGNIANIFGELISLIEPDKRQGCINELSVTLPYSKSIFSVPKNLDIYGTMNTSDHSLTKLDLALRRRFEFEELLPNYGLLEDIKVHNVNISEMLKIMNARIEVLLGRDYLIGHSYFLPLKEADNPERLLANIFKNKIIPLLQEYFFEDWERIQWVLNDHNKVPEYQFIQLLDQIKNDDLAELDLAQLFKNVRDIQHISDRRYQINHKAFGQMEAYSKIIAE